MEENLSSQNHQVFDGWRITLPNLAYTICGSILSERFFSGLLTGTAPLEAFVQTLEKPAGLANRGDEISICLRDLNTGPGMSPELDYQIVTGDLRLDFQEATAVARRRGSSMIHLRGQKLYEAA